VTGSVLLSIEDLRVYFYTYAGVAKAIDGVSMEVYEGESFALVGETGCGKSTIARAVLGMIPQPGRIVSGRVVFDGTDILKLPEEELQRIRGAKIAYIAQDPSSSLDPLFTVGAHVAETIVSHDTARWREAIRRAVGLLASVAIPEPEKRVRNYPHELSGGMRQRAVIATAIANKPKLLIADEPTTALDVTIQAQVMDLIMDLKKQYGSALMLITHNLGLVAEYIERIAVMYLGKIVEVSSVQEFFERPLHPYSQGLLKSIPNPLKNTDRLYSIPGTVPSPINPPPGCRFHPRCPYAMDVCGREEPPLAEVEEGHLAACWLAGGR